MALANPRYNGDAAGNPTDPRLEIIALSFQISKRAMDIGSLEELYYFLTNDTRSLIEFDRCHLVLHLGGISKFVATNNQAILDKRSQFQEHLAELAKSLTSLKKAQLLSDKLEQTEISEDDLPKVAKESLIAFIRFSHCKYLLCMPLIYRDEIIGHIVLEFLDNNVPRENEIRAFLNISPFLATAVAEKWALEKKPELLDLLSPKTPYQRKYFKRVTKYGAMGALGFIAFFIIFFLIPFDFTVGGEAVTAPKERHMAFPKIDGVVERVYVSEGSFVKKGDVLANLDATEIAHKIESERRQAEILSKEIGLLKRASDEEPAKLAESELIELKRKSKLQEIHFLEWQKQFLVITSPTSGTILSKDIDSLAGKKYKAGEPFCEIAAKGELYIDVYVPEDRISHVKTGQRLVAYLNSNPRAGHELVVEEIAPMSEAMPRLGNVYRIRAPFSDAPLQTRVGMKGFGRVHCFSSSLAYIVAQRLATRWNQFLLNF